MLPIKHSTRAWYKVRLILILLENFLALFIIVELNEFIKLVLNEFSKSKHLSINLSHVVRSSALFQMTHQVLEFVIVGVFFEWSNRNSVVQLCPKRVHCVVYDNYVL